MLLDAVIKITFMTNSIFIFPFINARWLAFLSDLFCLNSSQPCSNYPYGNLCSLVLENVKLLRQWRTCLVYRLLSWEFLSLPWFTWNCSLIMLVSWSLLGSCVIVCIFQVCFLCNPLPTWRRSTITLLTVVQLQKLNWLIFFLSLHIL